jgi:hypothetical protein
MTDSGIAVERLEGPSTVCRVEAAEPPQSRMRTAMSMVLELLDAQLCDTFRALMEETKLSDSPEHVPEAMNLVEIGQGELGRMRGKVYDDYDEFASELVQVRTLLQATVLMYGPHDTVGGWHIKQMALGMPALFALVEQQEGRAGPGHHEGEAS